MSETTPEQTTPGQSTPAVSVDKTPADTPEPLTEPSAAEWLARGRLLGFTIPAGRSGPLVRFTYPYLVDPEGGFGLTPVGGVSAAAGLYIDALEEDHLVIGALYPREYDTDVRVMVTW